MMLWQTGLAAVVLAHLSIMPAMATDEKFEGIRFKPLVGISSTMLELKPSDRYIGDVHGANDPLTNVTGVDVGFSLQHGEYPWLLSFKTNRLLPTTQYKQGTLYLEGNPVGEAHVARETLTGTMAVAWIPPWVNDIPVVPYLSYTRNVADNTVTVNGLSVDVKVDEYYWGPGIALPLNREFSSALTLTVILENDDAGTQQGFNMSLYKTLGAFDF